MKVLREDLTKEMELSGTRRELLAMSHAMRNGRGEVQAVRVSDPSPYDRSLACVEFKKASGKVSISTSREGESMIVGGALEFLSFLAGVIEDFAREADSNDHLHIEYFPEHDYLIEGADPLIVVIDRAANDHS